MTFAEYIAYYTGGLLGIGYVTYYGACIGKDLLRLARIKRNYEEWNDDVRQRRVH